MLIYGTKPVHITSEASNEVTCPLCENKTAMTITVYRKHFHVFWIPMFPLAKKTVMQCQSCGNEIEEKDIPLLISNKFQKVKEESKGPIWQFVGLAFFVIIVGLSIYSSGERDKQELIYITTPEEGDVYNYKVDIGSYSSLKVVAVSADSVFVAENEYEISKRSKVHRINKPENYTKSSYGISRDKIIEMYTSDAIFSVKR